MRRRTTRRIMIALGVGVIATVLNAWVVPPFQFSRRAVSEQLPLDWPLVVPADWPSKPTSRSTLYSSYVDGTTFRYDPDYENVDSQGMVIGRWHEVWRVASGWPMRSFVRYSGMQWDYGGQSDVSFGHLHTGIHWSSTLISRARVFFNPLPTLPLWPGFAINTIFYGTFAFAAMAGAAAIKRRRRIKRGLCIQCAYPLTGGDRCPECGTAVASSAKSPAPAAEPVGSTPI